MAFRITTTGTQSTVTFNDLGGRVFSHPITDFDLETEFSAEEISESDDIQNAIDQNWITVVDANNEPIGNVQAATSAIPLVTQAEAQGGTLEERRAWSPERVREAVEAISSAISLGNRITVGVSAGGQSVTTSFAPINFDAEDEKEGFDFTAPSNSITVQNDGLYVVAAHVTVDHVNNSSRTNSQARLVLNGSEVPLTRIAAYHRTSSQGEQSGGFLRLLRLTAGQVVALEVRRRSGSGTLELSPNGTALTLFEVGKGAKGDKGDPGSGTSVLVFKDGTVISGSPFSELNFKGQFTLTPQGTERVDIEIPAFQRLWKREEAAVNKTSDQYGTPRVAFSQNLPAGDYQVSWWYEVLSDNALRSIGVKVDVAGATVYEVEGAPGGWFSGAGYIPGSGSFPVTHTGGNLNVDLFYKSIDGNQVTIRRARVMVQKSENVEL